MNGTDIARCIFFAVCWLVLVLVWAHFVHWSTLGFALGSAIALGRQAWKERGT